MTNYGILIAYVHGILKRSLQCFRKFTIFCKFWTKQQKRETKDDTDYRSDCLRPLAGKAYASQVRQVFGSAALVRDYSIMGGSVGQMDRCDLYMISTDALDAMKKQGMSCRKGLRPWKFR